MEVSVSGVAVRFRVSGSESLQSSSLVSDSALKNHRYRILRIGDLEVKLEALRSPKASQSLSKTFRSLDLAT
jgi:hypothetical protein